MATLDQNIQRIKQAKLDLAASITRKGITVPESTRLDGYSALVDLIPTGGGGL